MGLPPTSQARIEEERDDEEEAEDHVGPTKQDLILTKCSQGSSDSHSCKK